MLIQDVQSYLSVRHAAGFALIDVGYHLRSFAAYSDSKGYRYINSQAAIEWARGVPSQIQRAQRLGDVARFARYLQAEDAQHEIPPQPSAASVDSDQLLTFSPMNRSGRSSNWPLSRATALCADRPTARSSHSWPVRDFASPKPSG